MKVREASDPLATIVTSVRTSAALSTTAAAALVLAALAAGSPRATVAPEIVTVSAEANIFGAGRSSPPAPAGRGRGKSPVLYSLPSGATKVIFSGGSGRVTCCTGVSPAPYSGPAGGSQLLQSGTNIPAVGGISGVDVPDKQMFLAGVFLGNGAPGGAAPPTDTATTSPTLRQVFYVGGGPLTVDVPAGATRLFLGFADAYGFHGPAGYYDDNAGTVRIGLATLPPGLPKSQKPAASLSLSLRDKKFHVADKNLPSCSARSGESGLTCTARNSAVLTLCNRDESNHMPYSLIKPNRFGGPAGRLVIAPGKCMRQRLVNPTKQPLIVKIYDEIHSQERLLITVLPAARG